MKLSTARRIHPDDISADYAEALAAADDGRATISDGHTRGTVTVWWHAAPLSLAPGFPAQVRVRA